MARGSLQGTHTILLLQTTSQKSSRLWLDFESINDACSGMVDRFELRVKELNPQLRQITYEMSDLYRWMDQMADMTAFDASSKTYVPHDRHWIKRALSEFISRA